MIRIRHHPEGIVFDVLVQPRASRNSIAGAHDGALKIRLTAPPVDNAANRMCIKFLAKCLGISKSRLEIIAGHAGRRKQVLFRGAIQNVKAPNRHLQQQLEALIAA